MTYQVYVIESSSRKHYIGLSENVEIRVRQHNDGLSKWTRDKGPWNLLWTSDALSLFEARRLENKLKRQKGGDGFYKITGLTNPAHNPAAAGS